jgi:hypothetical protein
MNNQRAIRGFGRFHQVYIYNKSYMLKYIDQGQIVQVVNF